MQDGLNYLIAAVVLLLIIMFVGCNNTKNENYTYMCDTPIGAMRLENSADMKLSIMRGFIGVKTKNLEIIIPMLDCIELKGTLQQ